LGFFNFSEENNTFTGGMGEPAYVKYFNDLRIDLGDYIWLRGEH